MYVVLAKLPNFLPLNCKKTSKNVPQLQKMCIGEQYWFIECPEGTLSVSSS